MNNIDTFLEIIKMQFRQLRLNKSTVFVAFFVMWTILISGIGKVDYAMNNSEMSVCLRLFEKEWRSGPSEYIDIPDDVRDTAAAKDLRKEPSSSQDSRKITDCSACNNKESLKTKEEKALPKDSTKDKTSKKTNDLNTDNKQENDKNNNDKNKLNEITISPKTEKSLKSNVTTRLNNILHRIIEKPLLTENPKLCSSVDGLKVLILVHTATKNFEKRILIRETWTNNSYYPNLGPVRTLFLLGRAPNPDVKRRIKQEFEKYSDILQGDFIDSYHNLTLKGVMAYKWVTQKCRNAKVILKVDDDVIINMFHFLNKTVPFIVSKSKHIACRRSSKAPIRRNPDNKWFIEEELFRGEEMFPVYCEGFTVAFSNDLLPSLYKSAMLTPFFWVDDVYLYGLVPRNIPDVHYSDLTFDAHVLWGIDKIRGCLTKQTKCTHFMFLFLKDAVLKMKKIWKLIVGQEAE